MGGADVFLDLIMPPSPHIFEKYSILKIGGCYPRRESLADYLEHFRLKESELSFEDVFTDDREATAAD